MNLIKLITVLCSVSLVSACGGGGGGGGGGGSGSGSGSSITATSISGVAFDGYLYKAKACLDVNDNLSCDSDEPFGLTDQNGKFTISGITQEMSAAHSLVVEAIEGTTIDQDNPNVAISKSYILTAPAGRTTVSPITTLIKSLMHSGYASEEKAVELIYSIIFPTAASDWQSKRYFDWAIGNYLDSSDSELRKLGWSLVSIAENLTTTGFKENFQKSFTELIVPNAAPIVRALSLTEIKSLVSSAAANQTASIDSLSDILNYRDNYFRIRSTKLDVPSKVFTFTNYDNYASMSPTNFAGQVDPTREYWELTNTSWATVSSSVSVGTTVTDLIGGPYGNSGVKLSVESTKLDGKSYDFSQLNRSGISHTFPTGSMSYTVSFSTAADRYILSGNALTVPLQQQSFTTVSDLVAAYPSSVQPSWANFLETRGGLLITFTPTDPTKGTLSFRDQTALSQVAVTGGAYEIQTVGGQQVLLITDIPEAALTVITQNPTALQDYKSGLRPFFAFVGGTSGGVREGVYTPANTTVKSTVQYNRTALNSILKALSLCQLSSTFTNESCP